MNQAKVIGRCADCQQEIHAGDKYWASTNLICDHCWRQYPLCSDDKDMFGDSEVELDERL